jgi:uncharacterized protein involved in exopolysaccharide biosynthesis
MSRIDDALKRLAGVVSAEPRTTAGLDRYASEGAPRVVEEPKRPTRIDSHSVAKFAVAGPRAIDPRPAVSHPAPAALPPPAAPTAPEAKPEGHVDAESQPLIDVRQLINYGAFVAKSVRRHKLLAGATVVMVIGFTTTAAVLLPKTYFVQTKLFAQRNAVMAALSNPGRAVPWDADAPTRAAAETVLRRDNLISLITQTDLIKEWDRRRAPVLKFKDWVVAKASRYELTPDDKLEMMVGLLEERMIVNAGPVGDGTVTIELAWPDAEMAYRLVQGAQQAFLEARQVAETAAIGESIAILERYSASLHDSINRTLAELERAQTKGGPVVQQSRVAQAARRQPASAVPTIAASLGVPELAYSVNADPALNQLKVTLENKRLELSRLEETRQRQVAELQGKLSQLKTVYTASHPSVLSAQQNLTGAMQDQPQALRLAAEIEELRAEYDKRLADATDLQIKEELARRAAAAATNAVRSTPLPVVEAAPQPAPIAARAATEPEAQFASLRLRSELSQLESVLERTDGARIELAVSQAAFKYRYSVIRPAQVPRDPVSPNLKMIFAAGFLASLLLAVALVVCKDLLSGKILETWQVERQLGLPVIGTLRIQ